MPKPKDSPGPDAPGLAGPSNQLFVQADVPPDDDWWSDPAFGSWHRDRWEKVDGGWRPRWSQHECKACRQRSDWLDGNDKSSRAIYDAWLDVHGRGEGRCTIAPSEAQTALF